MPDKINLEITIKATKQHGADGRYERPFASESISKKGISKEFYNVIMKQLINAVKSVDDVATETFTRT